MPNRALPGFRPVCRIAAGTAIAVAVMGLILGWALQIRTFVSVAAGLATMKPLTATGILASGVAVLLVSPSALVGGRRGRDTGLALGAVLLIIGLIVTVEHLAGATGGIDAILFPGAFENSPYPARAARMSLSTSVSLMLAGLAVLAVARPGRVWRSVVDGCAATIGAIALTTLVGYVYAVTARHLLESYTGMAINTGIGLGCVSVALLTSRPADGSARILWAAGPGGSVARRLFPFVLLGPLVLGWIRLRAQESGLVNLEIGVGLLLIAMIVVLGGALIHTAHVVESAARERQRLTEAARERSARAEKMEAIGRLAGGVAHDFNNLLTAITGYVDLVRQNIPADSPAARDLREMRACADRAAELTQQLLIFGRKELRHPEVVALNNIVTDIGSMLERIVGEQVEIQYRLSEGLASILVDPAQMEHVIVNLVTNARDAMPNGGTILIETDTITVDTHTDGVVRPERPGRYVVLSVTDEGTGIDEASHAQIFEPFYSTKEPGRGTGLGLSTVNSIVEQSGGHINLSSRPGHGSTFRLFLPAVEAATATAPSPPVGRTASGKETILLVEDAPRVRAVTMTHLTRLGYTVIEAADAAEALRAIWRAPTPVHLVVTDIIMPGMTGPDLAARLRERWPDIPVLFITGYAGDHLSPSISQMGRAHVLTKPYDSYDLARAVRFLLDAPGGGGHKQVS